MPMPSRLRVRSLPAIASAEARSPADSTYMGGLYTFAWKCGAGVYTSVPASLYRVQPGLLDSVAESWTLRRAWSIAETPYPKKTSHLPTILSREEVAQLLHAARTSSERILLMTLYATGARNAELTHLKVSDINSQRMVVHIRGGKGRKDRDVMLSAKLLTALRAHWRCYHRKSSTWLFPSNYRKDRPIDTKTVWYACQKSAQRAGLAPTHLHATSPLHSNCIGPASVAITAASFKSLYRKRAITQTSRTPLAS
jgi:integrase